MRALRLALVAPLALAGACGSGDDVQPGGLSAREAQELNEAAEMLDANAVDAAALNDASTAP